MSTATRAVLRYSLIRLAIEGKPRFYWTRRISQGRERGSCLRGEGTLVESPLADSEADHVAIQTLANILQLPRHIHVSVISLLRLQQWS